MRGRSWRRAPRNEGHDGEIVEIRATENESPSQAARRSSRHNQLMLAGCIGVVAILAVAATLVPLAMPRGDQSSPSATPSLPAEPTGSPNGNPSAWTSWPPETPPLTEVTPQPSPPDTPPPSSAPIVASGWPIKWPASETSWITPSIDPAGAVYLIDGVSGSATAIDSSGHQRTGWLQLPNGKTLAPRAFGSDGTIYVVDDGDVSTVYAFSKDGDLRQGWPVELPKSTPILPGPSGTLYTAWNGTLVVLGPDGTTRSTGDDAPDDLCWLQNAAIRPDGTLFNLCWTDGTYTVGRIAVFSSGGRRLASGSATQWNGMTMGSDGTVVAWRNETTSSGEKTLAKDTQVAVIGTNGKPVAGWPRSFTGAVSPPAVGPDGKVYLSVDSSGTQPAQVVAMRASGQKLEGWPYILPGGTGPRMDGSGAPGAPTYPVSPVLGRGGTVFQVADDAKGAKSVIALDASGRPRPGWPVSLPGPITSFIVGVCTDWCGTYYATPLVTQTTSGSALLYLHIGNQILTLTEDGRVAPGWPKKLQTDRAVFYGWSWWAATSDGGLVTLEEWDWSDATPSFVLTRWNADGTVAR